MPRNIYFLRTVCLLAVLTVGATSLVHAAGRFSLINYFKRKGIDLEEHQCDSCGRSLTQGEICIKRIPVTECLVGKKEVFNSSVRYEWVSIPETRYHFKDVLITKEIPCPYCMPVCEFKDGQRCVGKEKWKKHGGGTSECGKCSELHCKHIEPVLEKTEKVCLKHEKGETTIKVKYYSCVKVPYTVYRRVKKPICVKEPCYEKVKVKITRYICQDCSEGQGDGNSCPNCNGEGCTDCVK